MTIAITDIITNSTLTFSIGDSTLIGTDPDTSNPIYGTSQLIQKAKLDATKDAPRDVTRRSTNYCIWCEGFATNPSQLSPQVPINGVASAVISGVKGKFYLVHRVETAALVAFGLVDLAGQRIQGWFEPSLDG